MQKINKLTQKQINEKKFFEKYLKTGDYSIYEEYEFSKPLKGFKEEPVLEDK